MVYINTSIVTFNANGGYGTMEDQVFQHGVKQALNANTFYKDGYFLKAWANAPDGMPTISDQEVISTYRDLNLYAIWDDYGNDKNTAFNWTLTAGLNSINGTIDYFYYSPIIWFDCDCIKFIAPVTGTYTIFTSNQSLSTGFMDFQLYNDSLDSYIMKVTTSAEPAYFECNLTAGEAYYLCTSGFSGAGAYTINVVVP
jgi:hypothetical protein